MGPAVKFVSTTRGLIYEKQRLKQILGKIPSWGGVRGGGLAKGQNEADVFIWHSFLTWTISPS